MSRNKTIDFAKLKYMGNKFKMLVFKSSYKIGNYVFHQMNLNPGRRYTTYIMLALKCFQEYREPKSGQFSSFHQ